MSLQAQLGRLHTTRRYRVTFLHWCVHSMAPNPNSEPSQPSSSFTVALQHGSSKLPRLILQHFLRASKQKLRNPKRISSLRMAELAALPLIITLLACSPSFSSPTHILLISCELKWSMALANVLPPTSGKRAATDIWQSIRATYAADVSDFVCNKTMELFHLLQQFDGSHYKTLETDINLLLEQISAEKLSIRDLMAMCLVTGIKYACTDNLTWREAHLTIIKLLLSSWDKIDGAPDRLLIVFRKAQIAVNIMGSDPNFKPTRRSHIHGVLATHLAVKGIQAKGCNGCPLHCSTLRNGSYYWRNAPSSEGNRAHKPGNRAHLAVAGAHDDDSDTTDTAMLVINRALNDDHLVPDLRREIAAAAKTYDFARLEAFSDRCDPDVDNRAN